MRERVTGRWRQIGDGYGTLAWQSVFRAGPHVGLLIRRRTPAACDQRGRPAPVALFPVATDCANLPRRPCVESRRHALRDRMRPQPSGSSSRRRTFGKTRVSHLGDGAGVQSVSISTDETRPSPEITSNSSALQLLWTHAEFRQNEPLRDLRNVLVLTVCASYGLGSVRVRYRPYSAVAGRHRPFRQP